MLDLLSGGPQREASEVCESVCVGVCEYVKRFSALGNECGLQYSRNIILSVSVYI